MHSLMWLHCTWRLLDLSDDLSDVSGVKHVFKTGPDRLNDGGLAIGDFFFYLSLHPPLKVCLFNFKISESLIRSHGSSSAHAQKSVKQLLCSRALFKCSVEQSHSGWIQHRPCWKGLLPTFSHRQTKLVSLVPDPCQRRHTIPGRLPERKFENTIWAEQRWIKQVLLSPFKSIEFVV